MNGIEPQGGTSQGFKSEDVAVIATGQIIVAFTTADDISAISAVDDVVMSASIDGVAAWWCRAASPR